MQAIALMSQRAQQLHDPAAALVGPVAETDAPANLDEGGEAGEHDVDLALVEVPDIEFGVHPLARGLHLQAGKLILPEAGKPGRVRVDALGVVFFPHGLAFLDAALAEEEEKPRLFARGKRQPFHEAAAVVAALLKAFGAAARLHRERVSLRAIGAEKAVTQAVKAGGLKVRSKELATVLFVMELMLNHSVFTAAAGGV